MLFRLVRILLSAVAIVLLFNACGLSNSSVESRESQIDPASPTNDLTPAEKPALATSTPPSAYPVPGDELPPTPALSLDYPAPTLPPTIQAYPGGLVWIIRPVGVQCEEGTAPGYGDLREATSTLTAAGVRVAGAEMTELMVTSTCGSPTSAHFRAQINADDLPLALSLGWEQEG